MFLLIFFSSLFRVISYLLLTESVTALLFLLLFAMNLIHYLEKELSLQDCKKRLLLR